MHESLYVFELKTAIERIERAFAGVKLGEGMSIREADVIDARGTMEQRREARVADERDDWHRVPDEFIARYHWSLPYLDARSMRFYLPAFMIYALRHLSGESLSVEFMIYALQEDSPRFGFFTPAQKAAVRRFLRFMIHHSIHSTDAKRALDEVWMKGLKRNGPERGSVRNSMSASDGGHR